MLTAIRVIQLHYVKIGDSLDQNLGANNAEENVVWIILCSPTKNFRQE